MLETISVFSCLSEKEIQDLETEAVKKRFPKNTVLFSEGDETDSLYVISKGKVKAVITDENGREIVLSIFGSGEYFGEMAFIDDDHRSATILTKEPVQALVISRDVIKRVLVSNPDFAFNLLKGMVARLRQANHQIEGLALKDVYGRIARLFAQYATTEDGETVLEERFTHQEVANMIGSSREMVSRIFKELIVGEYISVDKQQITIKKTLPYAW